MQIAMSGITFATSRTASSLASSPIARIFFSTVCKNFFIVDDASFVHAHTDVLDEAGELITIREFYDLKRVTLG